MSCGVRNIALAMVMMLSVAGCSWGILSHKQTDENSVLESTVNVTNATHWINILSDDSMRGRFTPSEELNLAADIIARQFQNIGLEPGVSNSYIQRYTIFDELEAPNVVGILRGSDPELKNEYVAFSAHMDHIGTGLAIKGDPIYNGADDNASGTSAVILIATAMKSLKVRPRRSMIFILVSGEERGLLGSKWFVEHPTVPLDAIVADLNIDMIGRNKSNRIAVIGKQLSSLGNVTDTIAYENPDLGLVAIDDPWPEERLFFRSDHYSFAVHGIPSIFFFAGIHEDYHMPSDEADKINFEMTTRIARFIALTGLNVANAKNRPKLNKKAYDEIIKAKLF